MLRSPGSSARRHLVAGLLLAPIMAPGQVLWINEFHYDNAGTDSQEFVEVIAPNTLTDLASVRLTLYNGGDGAPYGTSHLLSTFTAGESHEGWTVYSKSINGLQNGAPDGLALDLAGTVVHFVSYEGSFTAASGPAASLSSSDIGLAESDATPAGSSIGLRGAGITLADFTWTAFQVATPGMLNAGQVAVPEPSTYAALFAAGLGVFAWVRRCRPRPGAHFNPVAADPSQAPVSDFHSH
ncbi:MAG: PEP-CTERM sorting domain-containing protein [Verrucomicrobiales bacterium]|nr:PEP-CTERM sorting domain-containing protein [Verrucomicrobiales bacterium]